MKKNNYIILFVLIIGIIGIIAFGIDKSFAIDSNTYTREELQNMVVSTALSYYYNNIYSDYEQKSMDSNSSYSWRNISTSPEMVGRGNNYNVDCSSFVTMSYLYSLGWDLSDYYNIKTNNGSYINNSKFYENGEYKYAYNSKENYQKAYMIYGKGQGTASMSSLAMTKFSAQEYGKEYISTDPTDEFIYYYPVRRTNIDSGDSINQTNDVEQDDNTAQEESTCNTKLYNETCEEQEKIKTNIINTLQPGDILVYRSYISNSTSPNVGHAILYIGDAIKSGERGFIHSKGTDFSPTANTIGEDVYSIRYDTWDDYFYKYIFRDSQNIYSSNFTIIRPINSFCTSTNAGEKCTINENKIKSNAYKENYTTNLNNALTRTELFALKLEQYQYKKTSNTKVINKYNSVNVGDYINYRVVLANKSHFNYCNVGDTNIRTKSACENNGNTWMTSDIEVDYKNLSITGEIPDGTEFVSCSKSCTYDKNTKTITWNNIESLKSNTSGVEYTYRVKVKEGEKITNKGMVVTTQSGNKLQLGKLTVTVNNTIDSINQVEYFQNTIDSNKTYNSNLDFIKDVYNTSYGIDFSYLDFITIKNAIFKNISNYYVRNDSLSSEADNKINKMLVPGIYGGRKFNGNDNGDRAKILIKNSKESTLEVGDILITYDLTNNSSYSWLFYGYDSNHKAIFMSYDDVNNKVVTYGDKNSFDRSNPTGGWEIFKIIYSYDLFLLLRPTRVYDMNNIIENSDVDDENIIKNINSNMKYSEFKNNINILDNITIKDKSTNKTLSDTDKVKTGDKITVKINDQYYNYLLSVLGDVNGDGNVNVVDIISVADTIVNNQELSKEYYYASDYNKDNNINVTDIIGIANKIVNNS